LLAYFPAIHDRTAVSLVDARHKAGHDCSLTRLRGPPRNGKRGFGSSPSAPFV
jgi:hypothetical protein